MPASIRLILAAFCVLTFAGCAPRPDPDNSAEMARVFGECSFKLNTSMLDLPVLENSDPRVETINKVVNELVKSRYTQFPWAVHTVVLENPLPNAFTTGGGFLAAFSGVYAMADNEAALAGIIAHELAHMEKLDPMEMAGYLEEMLAYRFEQNGLEDYETGQALKTVVDFCLAIPGLVSLQWKHDLNNETNPNTNEVFNDAAVPYIPFTYSDDPASPYSPEVRDPLGLTRLSVCNDKQRTSFDEFIVINPEYYLQTFPDRDSLPPIPDDIQSGIGGLPGAQSLWVADPWLAFQHTAFARYAECQSDEAGMLNLYASGYDPLALNSAFESILWLFAPDEKSVDWRFINHPSLAQRIEDNLNFISSNSDILPGVEEIQASPDIYRAYITMADNIPQFEAMRDAARNDLSLTSAASSSHIANEHFEPVTVVDLAIILNEAMAKSQQQGAAIQSSATRCEIFTGVYKKLTGKEPLGCLPN